MTNYQISITVTGHDKASGPLGSVGKALGGIGTVAGGILTAGALTAIGRQIFDLGAQALDSYASYERLGMALESLVARELVNTGQATDLASAMGMAGDKAKDLQDWITKLAIQSPFQQEDIANSFRLAMAYGFTTDESKRLTSAMTDFAAGSGASSETMNRIALALGQIKAKGKLAGGEMLQLTEAGLDVRGILAKAFGKTTEEIVAMQEKGLLPAKDVIEAITQSLENDFGGAAKKQASTFSGLISSLQDIKTVGLRTFFEGTFKAVQPYVAAFVDKLSSPEFMDNLKQIGQRVGDSIAIAIKAFQMFKEDIEKIQSSPIFQFIETNIRKIFEVLSQPQVMEAAQKIFGGIQDFLQKLGQEVLPFALEMFTRLSIWFQENGPLIGAFATLISEVFTNVVVPTLLAAWGIIQPLISGLVDLILGIGTMIMQVATGDWTGAWNTLVTTATNVGAAIWQAILGLLNTIAVMFGGSLESIKTQWTTNWNLLVNILKTTWELMKSAISNAFSGIITNVKTGIENIKNAFVEQVSNFVTIGQNIIEGLKEGIVGAFESLLGTLADMASQIASTIMDGLGIESPSKVFKWIGENLMIGLEQGITKAAFRPQAALDTLLQGLSGGGIGSGNAYTRNSTDNSQRFYAPISVNVLSPEPNMGSILKGLRSQA